MIRVFTGSDRNKISEEVKKILGENYEVFDGENLKTEDMVNIFIGTSLFAEKRKILLKDLTPARGEEARDFYAEIIKYVNTPHEIVIWETNVSQKKTYKDFLKTKGVEAKKFEPVQKIDMRAVFNIYDTAMVNGKKAVADLEKIQKQQDPYMFFGLMVSQAIKKFEWRQGTKEKRVLKELSKVDMQMKTTAVEPWFLIKSFLLRLKTI
ncbi:hypothetical protein IJI69_02030 [Candidatus Saccharibacteria bacterium]|nr:hypothetical protein [Candidatus Saccharibacteria bacterium]